MPISQATPLLQYIRKVEAEKSLLDLAVPELLERFLTRRDEMAFAAMVRRHGPMVMGLCFGGSPERAGCGRRLPVHIPGFHSAGSFVPSSQVFGWVDL